jgi:hypothetical protein
MLSLAASAWIYFWFSASTQERLGGQVSMPIGFGCCGSTFEQTAMIAPHRRTHSGGIPKSVTSQAAVLEMVAAPEGADARVWPA